MEGHHGSLVDGPVIRPGTLEEEEVAAPLLEAFENLTLTCGLEEFLAALVLLRAAVFETALLGDRLCSQMCKMQAIVEQDGGTYGVSGVQGGSLGDISAGGIEIREALALSVGLALAVGELPLSVVGSSGAQFKQLLQGELESTHSTPPSSFSAERGTDFRGEVCRAVTIR